MVVYLSLLVAILGLLLWCVRPNPEINPKIPEIGRIMFFCGLLAFLFQAETLVSLLRH